MKLSVIISTYNAEKWLEKVLFGYSVQIYTDFEVVIADDGSSEATKKIVDSFRHKFKNPIQHIWQPDEGFQKCKILNKAILASKTDYLLFTDGDCIPRKDFILAHVNQIEAGMFLSGGYFKLPMALSELITPEDIINQRCFSIRWLVKNGLKINFKLTKLVKFKWFCAFMNWVTPTKKTWNGHNSSGFKSDIVDINGFNNDMQYGGEDRELGERLFNKQIFSKQIRYAAICIHLDHSRSYESPEVWKKNRAIRDYNIKHKVTWIEEGLTKI